MPTLMKSKAIHLLALVVFLFLLLVTIYLAAQNTDAYKEAVRLVEQDTRVIASIGKIEKVNFKFWRGFEFTDNKANFPIEAISDKGQFVVVVRLSCIAGIWHVQTADIRASNSSITRITASWLTIQSTLRLSWNQATIP